MTTTDDEAAPPSDTTELFDGELLTRGRLAVEYADPVLTITLNRPDIRNAQLPETWEALAHIGSRLPASVRVVIVQGAGQSFSAGLDRSMFALGTDSVLRTIASAPDTVAHNMIAGFQTWIHLAVRPVVRLHRRSGRVTRWAPGSSSRWPAIW